jgi:hypothetical protein
MDLLTSNLESKPWGFCMIAFIARNDCCTLWNIHWNSMECLHGVTEWDAIFLKWHSATLIFQFFDATWPCFSWFDMNNEAASQAINAAERRRSRAAMCRCQGRSWGSCPWHVELQANLFGHMTLRNVVGVVALWHPSMCFVRCGTNVSWFALNLNHSLQQKVVVVDCSSYIFWGIIWGKYGKGSASQCVEKWC